VAFLILGARVLIGVVVGVEVATFSFSALRFEPIARSFFAVSIRKRMCLVGFLVCALTVGVLSSFICAPVLVSSSQQHLEIPPTSGTSTYLPRRPRPHPLRHTLDIVTRRAPPQLLGDLLERPPVQRHLAARHALLERADLVFPRAYELRDVELAIAEGGGGGLGREGAGVVPAGIEAGAFVGGSGGGISAWSGAINGRASNVSINIDM
jgi:hypothetical protein